MFFHLTERQRRKCIEKTFSINNILPTSKHAVPHKISQRYSIFYRGFQLTNPILSLMPSTLSPARLWALLACPFKKKLNIWYPWSSREILWKWTQHDSIDKFELCGESRDLMSCSVGFIRFIQSTWPWRGNPVFKYTLKPFFPFETNVLEYGPKTMRAKDRRKEKLNWWSISCLRPFVRWREQRLLHPDTESSSVRLTFLSRDVLSFLLVHN